MVLGWSVLHVYVQIFCMIQINCRLKQTIYWYTSNFHPWNDVWVSKKRQIGCFIQFYLHTVIFEAQIGRFWLFPTLCFEHSGRESGWRNSYNFGSWIYCTMSLGFTLGPTCYCRLTYFWEYKISRVVKICFITENFVDIFLRMNKC